MATWKYIKGSEADFEAYDIWTTSVWGDTETREKFGTVKEKESWAEAGGFHLIAQRERVTSINDDRLAQCIDNVNHPKHYTQGGIECIDAIKAATVGKSGIEAVCVANVVKYLWRYEEKNGVEDVKKARWYLERLISELESVK